MIYIGNDIVEVSRIKRSINLYGEKFINKIFNPEEIEYCKNRKKPYIHYAGRFAAKEAIKKAILSLDNKLLISLKNILIHRLNSGEPKPIIQKQLNLCLDSQCQLWGKTFLILALQQIKYF